MRVTFSIVEGCPRYTVTHGTLWAMAELTLIDDPGKADHGGFSPSMVSYCDTGEDYLAPSVALMLGRCLILASKLARDLDAELYWKDGETRDIE